MSTEGRDGRFALSMGPLGPRALSVVSFEGREEVSKPYRWEVTFSVAGVAPGPRSLLDQRAQLTIDPLAAAPRIVPGVVDRIREVNAVDGDRAVFRARIVPLLALLAHGRQSRIFQDQSVPEIVSTVLRDAGIAHRSETRAEYPARTYCVQYEETDLGFVSRLCAEVGISYRFDVAEERGGEAREVVVLCDGPAPELEGGARLILGGVAGSALLSEEHPVTRFEPRAAVRPRAYTFHGWDFRRPALAPRRSVRAEGRDGGALEVHEHHEVDEGGSGAESGFPVAHLEQLRRGALGANGAGHCPRLSPGRRFVLDEDGDESAHVLLRVTHEGRAGRAGDEAPTYENRFTCAPATHVPRPAKPRRVVRQVAETAIVVGPEGQEIHTDDHGRIRVRFPWDRRCAASEHASCWVRVAQTWAGDAWGAQMIPRVGMEVLVVFIGGDPSRPLVVGCLPNALHPPAFALPGQAAKSGIRTRSTPRSEGYSELSFDDAKGAERVHLRAERDLSTLARHDHSEETGNDRSAAVGRDRTAKIGRNEVVDVRERLSLTVAGTALSEMSDQKIAHATGGGASVSLAGGDASIQARGDVTISAGGKVSIDAAGPIHLRAGGAIVIEAAGALTILGASLAARAPGEVVVEGATIDLNP